MMKMGMAVDHETLRRSMLGEHLWSRRKKHCQTKGAQGALCVFGKPAEPRYKSRQ